MIVDKFMERYSEEHRPNLLGITWYDGTCSKTRISSSHWKKGTAINSVIETTLIEFILSIDTDILGCEWEDGIFDGGTFKDGNFKKGTFKNGVFRGGIWGEDSIWEGGIWEWGIIKDPKRKGRWKGPGTIASYGNFFETRLNPREYFEKDEGRESDVAIVIRDLEALTETKRKKRGRNI